jgi:protein-S-isoprenylcysteine O-methyltransferase Ste14
LTTPPALMLRIIDEEKGLMAALPGYPEYAATVRWRLVPGVW